MTIDPILASCGATEDSLAPLRQYLVNPFVAAESLPEFPLADASHVDRWRLYEREVAEMGTIDAIRRRLVQLRFPIAVGISGHDAYGRATKRGQFAAADEVEGEVVFQSPERIELRVWPTLAGHLPVITVGEREDFVTLVRALSCRNEPLEVPPSQGAAIVGGFNNWDRIHAHRADWESRHGGSPTEAEWQAEFRRLVPHKDLYQDKFVLLSSGFYSAISPQEAGLSAEAWQQASVAIRREHEFTHYFSSRVFGAMRNNLLDEVLADFVGMLRGLGRYDAALAKRCLGVGPAEWGATGRLDTYRGDPPIAGVALEVIKCLASRAVDTLSTWAESRDAAALRPEELAAEVCAMFRLGLDGLAAWDGCRPLN